MYPRGRLSFSAEAVKSTRHILAAETLEQSKDNEFSASALRMSWIVFIALHTFCFIYFISMALGYWNLSDSTFGRWLFFYDLGLDPEHDPTIAIVHSCVAAIHFAFLLWMIGWSLKARGLVFAVYNIFGTQPSTTPEEKERWHHRVCNVYNTILSKIGLVGVDGPYFDLVLLCREVAETALQTHQAYRMSLLLPRTQLNRGYVVLLVLNCWTTSTVHSAFPGSSLKRRFYAIMCDCALDLVSSVGISIVLLALYFPDFDVEIKDFPVRKWYEDMWIMHLISEFQILLVTSWGDLVMRVVFALSMLSNMNNMKKLLSTKVTPEKRQSRVNHRRVAVVPHNPSVADLLSAHKRNKFCMLEARFTQVLFAIWGIVILSLHLFAESISSLPQCRMQVKPWYSSQISCSLLVLDCYESELSGIEQEVTAQWSFFDPTTTAGVTIRHCPNVEVPMMLTKFSRLKMLKFYNSTITSWSEGAALSQEHHPNLIMLFLVRVNLPNGELPAGLRADDFPQALMDIEFCLTNLRTLPDDIDLKWPQLASMYLEASKLTEVPPSLARLAPYDLSLAGNPISSIPARLFEGELVFLHIGATLISELPEHVHDASPLQQVRVGNTNISFFWVWIDPIVENVGAVLSDVPIAVVATNTPYCTDLQRIFDGDQLTFSATQHDGESLFLTDAAIDNWPKLKSAVSCDKWPRILYPIEFEDEYNGM